MSDDISTVIQKKICMLGDFAVGKTSLVMRFVEGRFDERYLSTIGVKVSRRTIELADYLPIHLLVWDLAGSEEFTGVQTSYLQGASGALLVCDLTRKSTLAGIATYAQRLRQVNPRVVLALAGNKIDLLESREIDDNQLAEAAGRIGAEWFVASAKSGNGVAYAFERLAQKLLERK